jgi:hypothetical protein
VAKFRAYVDEFGTNSLDVESSGVTSHFILAAVLVDEATKMAAHEVIEKVRKDYFQGSEIKSSKIKKKSPNRRISILSAFCQIDFMVYALVVDKREIKTKGLSIKQSFYKFFHKELTQDLNRINSEVELFSDQIGTDNFMASFIKYLAANTIQYNLFSHGKKYQFTNSKNDDLIQLSDFIAGTLGKAFNLKDRDENSDDFLAVLKEKLHVRFWPPKYEDYLISNVNLSIYDSEISKLGLELAHSFVERFKNNSNDDIRLQIVALDYLRLMHRISPERFVPTFELMSKLQTANKWSVQDFRRKIIGGLRDNHVIIVSSQEGGYKLPLNLNDIYKFVNRYNSILQPMIGRLRKCHSSILLRTMNKLDILDQAEYHSLKFMIKSQDDRGL